MHFSRKILLAALSTALYMQQGTLQAAEFVDVLNTPAMMSQLAIKSPLNDVVNAGNRLVAVGLRGHILYSDDAGKSWVQAQVPLSSDLTAVFFATPAEGWAVGHDGVVLHSTDSGATWTKQLDGTQTGKLMLDKYTALAATDPANEQYAALLADAQRMADEGADKPFLDVWFADSKHGYIVGAFGMIFHTADGGQSWTPLNEKVENPSGFHLNSISGFGSDDVAIVGEQGLVLFLDHDSGNFVAKETPYTGTYFGLQPTRDGLIVYGLRGSAYITADKGETWAEVKSPGTVAMRTSQTLTASTTDTAGHVFLFTKAGHVATSTDGGASFRARPQSSLVPINSAVATNNQTLILVGDRGVRVFPIE